MSEEIEDEGPVGITDHELVALVDMSPTPSGRRALQALGLEALLEDERQVRAGQATLLVRDVAGLDGDDIVAQGFAAAIGTMLTTAHDIVRLSVGSAEHPAGRTLLVASDVGAFLLDLTALGVHAAQPFDTESDLLDIVRDVLDGLARDAADGHPLTAEVARFPVAGADRVATLALRGPDLWAVADAEATTAEEAWDAVLDVLALSDHEAAHAPRRAAGPRP